MTADRTIRLGLHSFSFDLHRRYGEGFDVFALIDAAVGLGMSGVHVSLNDENYRWIGGTSPDRLRAIGEAIRGKGMFLEIDTSGTGREHLVKLLNAARLLGADRLRTYVTVEGSPEERVRATVEGLLGAAPVAADLGIALLVENHEDFTSQEMVRIMETVNHPSVGAVYDFGNSMMVLEDPMEAAKGMAPFVRTVHVKDHILTIDPVGGGAMEAENAIVCGVPIGRGNIDIAAILGYLLDNTGLNRVCIQSVYGYRAPIARNLSNLAKQARRHPMFVSENNISDDSFCILDAEALSRVDPTRLLNYEQSAVALGVGKVREILGNLGYRPACGGLCGEYRRENIQADP